MSSEYEFVEIRGPEEAFVQLSFFITLVSLHLFVQYCKWRCKKVQRWSQIIKRHLIKSTGSNRERGNNEEDEEEEDDDDDDEEEEEEQEEEEEDLELLDLSPH